jgi:Mn-containing catalase
LLENCTKDFGHTGMLAIAIALNLEDSPAAMQERAARGNPMASAAMCGMNPRAYLSGGGGVLVTNSEGIASRVADGMRYVAEYLTG